MEKVAIRATRFKSSHEGYKEMMSDGTMKKVLQREEGVNGVPLKWKLLWKQTVRY